MLNLKNRYPIGIEIADHSIFAAQLKKTRKGIAVRELFHRKLGNGQTESLESYDAMVPVLKEIGKNKRFRGKSAVILLPARYVDSFPVSFKIGSDQTMEEAIVLESGKNLTFPAEEAVIDYPSVDDISSGKNKKYKANIVAGRRDRIETYVSLLKKAGLSAEAIDFGLSALLRLHHYLYAPKDNPVILCNIGHRQSLIAVVTKDSILAQRNVPWGIQTLLDRLETNLELAGNSEQAAGMLTKYGLFYENRISSPGTGSSEGDQDNNSVMEIYRTIFQVLTPCVDELIHEFYQVIGYVRAELQGAKFEEICMYGQAISIHHLDQYLEGRLNIPTRCINPMAKLSLADGGLMSNTAGGAPFALALGLAMRKVKWL